jgi:polygalacturonase
LAVPTLPTINTNNVVNITNFGAVSSTTLTNTTAIQSAINAAAAGGTTNGAAGGTVEIPPGIYLSGPITLKSAVNLQLDSGAILRMLPFGQYPVTWFTNGGTNVYFTAANFISASSLHDVEISGSGMIQGQGEPWWPWANTNNAVRPIMIRLVSCNRELIQNVTLSNSPMFHISISGSAAANTTVQGVTIRANSSSDPINPGHNTDACDVAGTSILVQNCNISVGDDEFTCGGGTSDVLITNNTYGNGHGVSIGSYTSPGVSTITVINCTFNGTDNGIRIKSDDGRGGLIQNISYYNIGMTNVHFPIQIYAYYLLTGTPSSISPAYAAAQPVAALNSTPAFRNITFSNITATSISGYPVGIIWARTEMPATNIVFNKINVTGNRNFCLYNVSGAQFIDCNIKVSSTFNTFTLFNAQVIVTNSTPTNTLFTFDGLTTNGYGNSLAFYNAQASLKNTNVFDDGPLTIGGSKLTVSNNLALFSTTTLNYILGTNAATVSVVSNMTLGGTINVTNGAGFTNGAYTLLTYAGTLNGSLPTLAGKPAGFNYLYSLDTNTPGQVRLLAQSPPSPVFTAGILSATGGFVFNATNGPPSNPVYVLAATNLALPPAQWTPVATNRFDANGQLVFTNASGPASPQTFYLLELP